MILHDHVAANGAILLQPAALLLQHPSRNSSAQRSKTKKGTPTSWPALPFYFAE